MLEYGIKSCCSYWFPLSSPSKLTTFFGIMRLHIKRTLITIFTTMILTHYLTFASTLVSTLSKKHWELLKRLLRIFFEMLFKERTYLSPLAPVPLRTPKLVTISNIYRLLRLITILIVNKHRLWLWVDTSNASNLLATFFAARHRALSPSTRSPFILGSGGSGLNIVNVVIKYWCVIHSLYGDFVSGCCNIWIRRFLNLIKETTPFNLRLDERRTKITIIKEIHLIERLLCLIKKMKKKN